MKKVQTATKETKPITRVPGITAEQIANQAETSQAPVAPAPVAEAPVSARTASIRRSSAGKFHKESLTAIGGQECQGSYGWSWAARDAFMAKDTPEAKMVKARYEAHLATVKP